MYPIRGTVFEKVIQTKRRVIVPLENPDEIIDKFPCLIVSVRAGMRSVMSVPLIAQNELIGNLILRSKSRSSTPNSISVRLKK